MWVVSRSALLIRPKEPYLEWAASIDEESRDLVEVLAENTSVYLIAETEDGDDDAAIVRRYFKTVFEAELQAWHREEARWPRERDYWTFQRWFDATVQPLIFDLQEGPVESERL